MLIDFHTHCFPDAIYASAMQKLTDVSGNLISYSDGSADGLKKSMAKTGVDKSVVLHIATNAHQMPKVNDFAAAINSPQLISFGSVHPDAPNALEELERISALGLKGVKFHPDYQGFFSDDEKMKPIYKKVSSLGLIAVFHAGLDYGFWPPYKNMPRSMAKAASWFDSPVVAAHWGGLNAGEDVIENLCGIENLYFDTSFGYASMPKAYALKIVEKHGTDKILFGTDNPWHDATCEMRLIDSLALCKDELDAITHKNAQKLLGI